MGYYLIANSIFQNLITFAERRGIKTGEILLQIRPEWRTDSPSQMIPFSQFVLIYEYLLQKTGEELPGLQLGKQYSLAALGIVGQLVQQCRTIGEGLEKCASLFGLISNVMQLSLDEKGSCFRLVLEMDPKCEKAFPAVMKNLTLSSMLFAFLELGFLLQRSPSPRKIGLKLHSLDPQALRKAFRQEVYMGEEQHYIEYDKALLSEKIQYADYELLLSLEQIACNRLAKLQGKTDMLSDKIRSLVYSMLDPQIPSIESLAENLAMSPRNLQRKLKAEGATYSRIIEEIKKDMAVEYLQKDLSVKEISYLMGYSESSSFVNAFRKWFGQSPLNYKLSQA